MSKEKMTKYQVYCGSTHCEIEAVNPEAAAHEFATRQNFKENMVVYVALPYQVKVTKTYEAKLKGNDPLMR